jgi:hypothetical protein
MLDSKIKIEIDTNDDELLKTIWEHLEGRNKRRKEEGILLIKKLPSIFLLRLFWPIFHIFRMKLKLKI